MNLSVSVNVRMSVLGDLSEGVDVGDCVGVGRFYVDVDVEYAVKGTSRSHTRALHPQSLIHTYTHTAIGF